jgi:polysaccharide biosynthesis transport protein
VGRRGRPNALTIGFTVGFQHRSPEVAARVANELVTLILAEDVKSRTSRASETTRFLEREADRRRRELVEIEAHISVYKLENDSALPEKLPSLMNQLERAKNELASLEREIFATHEQQRLMELELNVRRAGANSGEDGTRPSGRPPDAARGTQCRAHQEALRLYRYPSRHPGAETPDRRPGRAGGDHGDILPGWMIRAFRGQPGTWTSIQTPAARRSNP